MYLVSKKQEITAIKNKYKGFTNLSNSSWFISLTKFLLQSILASLNLKKESLKTYMNPKPLFISETSTASKALSIMNNKKITSLCVHQNKNKNKTIGFIHIHSILDANIT